MQTFYSFLDPETGDHSITHNNMTIARCKNEAWSCAIADALNMVDTLAELAKEMSTWPK